MAIDDKPLEGRRVIVTRAAEQALELTTRLKALGAEVLQLPLVEFAPAEDTKPLDEALAEIERFDWLLLTSQNAVQFLAARAKERGVDLGAALDSQKPRPQVAVVGRMTETVARAQKWRVDRVASGSGGLEMVRELESELSRKRILLARSDRATPDLPRALRSSGADVVAVVAYRTLIAKEWDPIMVEMVRNGAIDVVTFASPSAFHSLEERLDESAFRKLTSAARLAAIGPTTAAAIREGGCAVAIEARVPTAAGLVAAIAAYYASHPVSPGRTP